MKQLSWNEGSGTFYREIGKRQNKRPPRFYLGSDEATAFGRRLNLEKLWKAIEKQWSETEDQLQEHPFWNDSTIQIANAIAKGKVSVVLTPPEFENPTDLAKWFAGQTKRFSSIIHISIAETKSQILEETNTKIVNRLTDIIGGAESKITRASTLIASYGGKIQLKESLFDALNIFIEYIKNTNTEPEEPEKKTPTLSAFEDEKIPTLSAFEDEKRGKRIIGHTDNCSLSDFNSQKIYSIFEYWINRPNSKSDKKKNKKLAYSTCKNTLVFFKKFIKWLNKTPTIDWKKPSDLEFTSSSVKFFNDSDRKPLVFYKKEELRTIWEYATLFERKLVLTALTCGFGANCIGKLKWEEVDGNKIKGLRPKTGVYGKFWLSDTLLEAMGPHQKKGYVFTSKGSCLVGSTKGGNRKAEIPNAWNRLINRIKKDKPEFKFLPFHCLRKTGSNLIRKIADGETAEVFLRHGKPVPNGDQLEFYTTPAFKKVFRAQKELWRRYFSKIFTNLNEVKVSRKLTNAQISEIKTLRAQGIKTAFIGKQFNITPNTVRRICKKVMTTPLDKDHDVQP